MGDTHTMSGPGELTASIESENVWKVSVRTSGISQSSARRRRRYRAIEGLKRNETGTENEKRPVRNGHQIKVNGGGESGAAGRVDQYDRRISGFPWWVKEFEVTTGASEYPSIVGMPAASSREQLRFLHTFLTLGSTLLFCDSSLGAWGGQSECKKPSDQKIAFFNLEKFYSTRDQAYALGNTSRSFPIDESYYIMANWYWQQSFLSNFYASSDYENHAHLLRCFSFDSWCLGLHHNHRASNFGSFSRNTCTETVRLLWTLRRTVNY